MILAGGGASLHPGRHQGEGPLRVLRPGLQTQQLHSHLQQQHLPPQVSAVQYSTVQYSIILISYSINLNTHDIKSVSNSLYENILFEPFQFPGSQEIYVDNGSFFFAKFCTARHIAQWAVLRRVEREVKSVPCRRDYCFIIGLTCCWYLVPGAAPPLLPASFHATAAAAFLH